MHWYHIGNGFESVFNFTSNCLKCITAMISHVKSYVSPQFKYMIFSLFTCVIHLLRVYKNSQCDQLPDGLSDSSVGRALHWYHRGQWFESLSGLNFFSGFNFTTALSCVHTCNCSDQSCLHIQKFVLRKVIKMKWYLLLPSGSECEWMLHYM